MHERKNSFIPSDYPARHKIPFVSRLKNNNNNNNKIQVKNTFSCHSYVAGKIKRVDERGLRVLPSLAAIVDDPAELLCPRGEEVDGNGKQSRLLCLSTLYTLMQATRPTLS
ncbi:hypothetical protein OUZ56_004538 [Daphnia magna]|uniref:Uncharacterized protein n=1 Tax=Daphnia magna TaxID=35525 RepID=A0ABQ9YQ34_9CRUS|nr:hypothetical protein OUZ56_004538 [Daphnia magna]